MIKLYNWNELAREQVRAGIERCGFRGDNAVMVMNWISPRIDVRPHQHEFEQLVICVQGSFRYHVGDEAFDMTPGSMLRVPPRTMHYVEATSDEVALNLDVFAPARDDYLHLTRYQDDERADG